MRIRFTSTRILLAIIVAGCTMPATVWSSGMINYENGSPIAGMAGAGYAALAQDASTVFNNPAGMTQLKKSEVFLGLQPTYIESPFHPGPGTNVPGGGNGGGNSGQGFTPSAGVFGVYSLTNDIKLGLALNSYYAGTVKYDSAWVGRYFNQEASEVSLSFTPAVAYRATDWISLGAGLNVMYSTYNTQVGFHNVDPITGTTAPDGQISTNSNGTGVGANLGVLLTPREGTRIGVDWLSQVNLKFSDTPHCTGIATGPGNTSGNILTASGLCTHTAALGQKVPQQVMVSAYQAISDRLALVANVGWQQWSKNGQVTISVDNTRVGSPSFTGNLNYKDTYHLALGTQYMLVPKLMVMGGLSFDSSPADVSTRSVSAPYDQTWRYGVGTMYTHSDTVRFGGSFELVNSGPGSLTQHGVDRGTVSGSYSPNQAYVLGLYGRWLF